MSNRVSELVGFLGKGDCIGKTLAQGRREQMAHHRLSTECRVMDEAADCSDFVIAPTTTGPAGIVKTFETSKTLGALDILYAILLARIIPNTLSLKQSINELEERYSSYFDVQVPSREALKSFFGNDFGDDFYGYVAVYEQLKESIKEDREIYGGD